MIKQRAHRLWTLFAPWTFFSIFCDVSWYPPQGAWLPRIFSSSSPLPVFLFFGNSAGHVASILASSEVTFDYSKRVVSTAIIQGNSFQIDSPHSLPLSLSFFASPGRSFTGCAIMSPPHPSQQVISFCYRFMIQGVPLKLKPRAVAVPNLIFQARLHNWDAFLLNVGFNDVSRKESRNLL